MVTIRWTLLSRKARGRSGARSMHQIQPGFWELAGWRGMGHHIIHIYSNFSHCIPQISVLTLKRSPLGPSTGRCHLLRCPLLIDQSTTVGPSPPVAGNYMLHYAHYSWIVSQTRTGFRRGRSWRGPTEDEGDDVFCGVLQRWTILFF